jgi:hypothetical protein
MSLIAKSIVKDQWWVITDGQNKVGNVTAENTGYRVTIGNNNLIFPDTRDISKNIDVKFQKPVKKNRHVIPYAQWPTPEKTYNNMYDVKKKLHIFTKTKKSKCYHAAGWFKILMNSEWILVFCPKYIFIQRYEYTGPFMSEHECFMS